MKSKISVVLSVMFFYGNGVLWFEPIFCDKTEKHVVGSEHPERYFKSKDLLNLGTMGDLIKIRRFLLCKHVAEGGCRVFKMNISGYRCSSLTEENADELILKKGRTSRKKKTKVRKQKTNPASKTCRGTGPCPAVCTSSVCRCQPGLHYHPQKKLCFKGRTSRKKKTKVRKQKTNPASKTCRGTGPCPAVCTSGVCRCQPGLHYHPQKKLCFKGRTSRKKKTKVRKQKTNSASKTCRGTSPCPAVCTSGVCRCQPGLHYHPQKKLCFKACKKYGTDIIVYKDISIKKYNDKTIVALSRKDCAKACLEEKSFTCVTFDYTGVFAMLTMCYMSQSTYYTVPSKDRETTKGWVLGARNCIE